MKGVEVFGFKAFGVDGICKIRDFDFFDVISVEFGKWFKLKVDVLGTFEPFKGGYFQDEFIVFHFEEVDGVEFLLIILLEPFIELFFGFLFLFFGLILVVVHFEVFDLFVEFAVVEDSFDLFSEGNEVLNGLGFAGKNHVEFVVKVFVGFVSTLINFFQEIEHEEFPELGGVFDQDISEFLQESVDIIEVFFVFLLLLGLQFAVEFKVDKVGSEIELGDGLVGFEQGIVFAVGLLGLFPALLFFHVNLFWMEEVVEVLFFEFGDFFGFLGFFGEFGFGEPFFSFLGGFDDVVNDAVVVAVDFLFEELGDPAISVLVSPQVAQLF